MQFRILTIGSLKSMMLRLSLTCRFLMLSSTEQSQFPCVETSVLIPEATKDVMLIVKVV